MRIPILICAVLALGACGGKNAAGNSAATEQNAASETVTNDMTAIDAATGEAANMAPDVSYSLDEANLESGANNSNVAAAPRGPARKVAKPSAPETNSIEAAPANNAV